MKKIIITLIASFFVLNSLCGLADFTKAVSYEGKLIRPIRHSNVFIISKGKKRQIPSIEIFDSYGYKWSDVIEIDQSVEHSYDLTILIKTADSEKVYYLANRKKLWIPTSEIFLAAGYHSVKDEVAIVNDAELNYYRDLKFVRKKPKQISKNVYVETEENKTIYLISDFGAKRPIRSAEIFESYGKNWSSVRSIPNKLLDAFPDTVLVRAENDYKVYKIENGKKRWIVNQGAFIKNGFSFRQVEEITILDSLLYLEGEYIG